MSDLTLIERAKIGLMTQGMKVSRKAREEIAGKSNSPLTLADYASTSGISMELPRDVWVNAPIMDHNSNFVTERTPYSLEHSEGRFYVTDGEQTFEARPIPVPSYHNRVTSKGTPFTHLAITHTDRVRISPIGGCAVTCDFCDIPFTAQYRTKSVEDLTESVQTAIDDPIQPAKHILISGGTPRKGDYAYQQGVYEAVAKAFPDVSVDVMMVPMKGLLDSQELARQGIGGLSINLELWNDQLRRQWMHGKGGLDRNQYLEFIEGAVPHFKGGNVRSLLMVGIEPIGETLKGVEALAQRGADPVLSPFRPDPATPMANHKPSTESELEEVFLRSREITEKYGVKLGPRCIPCSHNTLTLADESGKFFHTKR